LKQGFFLPQANFRTYRPLVVGHKTTTSGGETLGKTKNKKLLRSYIISSNIKDKVEK